MISWKYMNLGHKFSMSRSESKFIGTFFMLAGFFLATPPGFPPDDFLNFWVAEYLSNILSVSMGAALLISYTVVAWTLFILGAMIYPYNTGILVNSKMRKLKAEIYKLLNNPLKLIIAAGIFIWLYKNFLAL